MNGSIPRRNKYTVRPHSRLSWSAGAWRRRHLIKKNVVTPTQFNWRTKKKNERLVVGFPEPRQKHGVRKRLLLKGFPVDH